MPGVHAVFVTGLTFVPLATKPCSSAGKQVSRPDKLVLVSVSADRTCSATLVGRKSGKRREFFQSKVACGYGFF